MDGIKEGLEHQNGLKPVERKVLSNFFWSFHHSQGNPTLQTLISIHMARQYPKEEIGDVKAFEEHMKPQIERLRVPAQHMKEQVDERTGEKYVLDDKNAQENEAGFQSQWGRLMMVFNRVYYDKPNPRDMLWFGGYEGNVYNANRLSSDEFVSQIATHMMDEDLSFQTKERQNRKDESDPHSSHLQMYLLAGKPAQSPEFDRLYADVRGLLGRYGVLPSAEGVPPPGEDEPQLGEAEVTTLRDKYQKLTQAWEQNHPGLQFTPEQSAA